jgi:hypothetical protein
MLGIRNSFRGGLNLDDDYFNLPQNSYVDALNVTIDAVEHNRDLAITNITGNRLVSYSLPSGECVCIGAEADQIRNRVIYFIWNANGYHSILSYNNTTRAISKILENLTDTGGEDILGFSRYKKILHIEIINRGDEGDLLYWTDGYTQPKGLIIDKVAAGTYGTVLSAYIEAAKRPPLVPASVAYGDDPAHTNNSLRIKLYQFQYRWTFDDLSKSTWSQWSDVPLPLGADNPDTDIDPTKNNVIFTTVTSGLANVTDIEIAVRQCNGALWSDTFLAVTLNKAELGIADEASYQYSFYNDGIYPALDQREAVLLFDWVPLLAKSMVLANGNTLVYGAITEGYDRLADVDITLSSTNLKNTSVSTGGATLTYSRTGPTTYTITVGGTVATNTRYRVFALIYSAGTYTQITLSDYTSTSGQTTAQVAQQLLLTTNPIYQNGFGSSSYFVDLLNTNSFILTTQIDYNSSGTTISTQTSWLWYSKYSLGLVYFDEHGRTNGVVYRTTQCDVTTGAFELDSGVPKTPVIDASIDHTPPTWAVKYMWARTRNLTYNNVFFYVTNDYQTDGDYYYLGLQNVQYFYDKNNKCIYSNISSIVQDGDRVKVVAQANNTGYTGTIWTQDYEILGVVERTMTGTSENGSYIKVSAAGSAPSPDYSTNMLVMVYSPAKSSTSEANQVFFEFGNTYDIYEDGGNRYHRGMEQDQTNSQPATFRFTEGDIYYKRRTCYYDLIPPEQFFDGYYIMDANYSDFFSSAVNDNGRPEPIDVDAKQTYFPATVRFGQEFQPNTNINGLPRFYYANFKDYNRIYGSILKMRIRDQYLKVGQELKIGVVPVNLQIIKTISGDGQLTASDELLNTINYYSGEFGVGDCPEAWSSFNFSDYFIDNRRGAILRLSGDGITPISQLYKVNSWSSDELPLRNGSTYFCYGCFDQKLNNYILAIDATPDSAAQTIIFDEENNIFQSFISAHPEMMCTLGNLLITWKNGALWTHDNTRYNSFYGVDYESYVTPVFSEPGLEKKTWQSVTEVADGVWDCPTIYSNVNSYSTQRQETNLVPAEFIIYEGNPTASIKRDTNSAGGKWNGDFMKGNWLAVKFRKENANNLVFLNICSVKFVDSPLTAR